MLHCKNPCSKKNKNPLVREAVHHGLSSHGWSSFCHSLLLGGLVAINFIFPYVKGIIIPIDELIFFRGVAQPPTSLPIQWPYGIQGIPMFSTDGSPRHVHSQSRRWALQGYPETSQPWPEHIHRGTTPYSKEGDALILSLIHKEAKSHMWWCDVFSVFQWSSCYPFSEAQLNGFWFFCHSARELFISPKITNLGGALWSKGASKGSHHDRLWWKDGAFGEADVKTEVHWSLGVDVFQENSENKINKKNVSCVFTIQNGSFSWIWFPIWFSD